jgi:hypothetical protein
MLVFFFLILFLAYFWRNSVLHSVGHDTRQDSWNHFYQDPELIQWLYGIQCLNSLGYCGFSLGCDGVIINRVYIILYTIYCALK